MKLTKEIEIKMPTMPNFLTDGEGNTFSVGTLSSEEAEQIADQWRDDFLEHVEKRRATIATIDG